ncbi:MAG: type II secretion system GspH family protein [Anaerohalosphaeraceae bacterium]|nr:type II secretion system GspH family protein [Anaerohalosphaeraceae bacterium]
MTQKKAFTLVEILVVISIIALLMGILMPALVAVRKSSKKMICATNLKQISLAINLYAEDYSDNIIKAGEIPESGSEEGLLGLWHIALLPYVAESFSGDLMEEDYSKLWFCPEDKDPYPLGYKNSPHGGMTSYALNGYHQDANDSRNAIKLGPAGGYKFAAISHPVECMLMGETSYASQFYDIESEKTRPLSLVADDDGIKISIFDPPDSNSNIPINGHHRMTSGFYHNDSMNIMFVDGHIGNIKGRHVSANDTYYPVNYRSGNYAFWPSHTLPTADENPLFWGPGY